MLKRLRIQNLAVIDEAELEIGSGFVCLTGESGAGKSVLIDALLLLGGARASAELVRTGCDRAVVEAEFSLDGVVDASLELVDEDRQLFLRREVTAEGKSRALINGVGVPNGVLALYGQAAFEIHGQHGQQRLLKAAAHLEIFDDQTQIQALAEDFEHAFGAFRKALRDFRELKEGEAARLKELDFIGVQIAEIEEAKITEDDALLDMKLKRARNAEEILASRQTLADLLHGRLGSDLRDAAKQTARLAEYRSNLKDYVEQIEGLQATVMELRNEIDFWDEGGPDEDLAKLEARETVLNKLFMKYGRDVGEVLAELARLKTRRDQLSGASSSVDQRRRALDDLYAELCAKRATLFAKRDKARAGFTRSVCKGLADLALNQSAFEVAHTWSDWPEAVTDAMWRDELRLSTPELQFLFSSNPGEPVKPLSKVASGGELSRVLLALINAFQRPSHHLLVFDEIDAGLGGETAHAVGAKLAELGEKHQVLCVTHFAQVASFAQQQIKLEKRVHKGRTFTSMSVCDYEMRVVELARLLGGDAQAENLQDHARKLLASRGVRSN